MVQSDVKAGASDKSALFKSRLHMSVPISCLVTCLPPEYSDTYESLYTLKKVCHSKKANVPDVIFCL